MSRFLNLEFNDGESKSQHAQEAQVKDERYYFGLAQRAFEQVEFDQALRYYSKVLEFNPANAGAWTGQVRALIELGEYREARVWADKALEKFPNEPELLAAKAVALGRGGDQAGAMAFSDASLEEHGDTPYIWLARGDVLLAGRETRAEYCFEKALTLAARDWVVAWLAARIRYYHRQFTLALKLAQQALERNSTQSAIWLQLGLCQTELGLTGPALRSLEQARQLNPHCRQVGRALRELHKAGAGFQPARLWRWLFRA